MKRGYERTPFTASGTINREMAKQAARHDLEEAIQWRWVHRDAFWEIRRESMIAASEVSGDSLHETGRGREFKELCQDYVAGNISQIEFQNRFNKFVKEKLWLPKEQQFVATNVLEKLEHYSNLYEKITELISSIIFIIKLHIFSYCYFWNSSTKGINILFSIWKLGIKFIIFWL